MKKYPKYIIALIACVAMLGGCSGTARIDYADTYIEGQDSQENLISYGNFNIYAQDENSFYFICDGFLYSINKASKKCQPLCNRSDCMHDEETSFEEIKKCRAFIDSDNDDLAINGEYIYYKTISSEPDKDGIMRSYDEISRISLKDLKTETVYKTEDNCIGHLKIHRGYIYLTMMKWDSEGMADEDKMDMYRFSINGNPSPEKIVPLQKQRKKYNNMTVSDTRFYGNHIFFEINYTESENEKLALINFDLDKKTWNDLNDTINVNIDTSFTIYNDKVIFGSANNVFECNYDGTKLKKILNGKKLLKGYKYFTPYCNDGELLYITAANSYNDYSQNVIVCDKEYNVKLKKLPLKIKPLIGFNKEAFIQKYNSELYWIDKSSYKAKKIYEFSVTHDD